MRIALVVLGMHRSGTSVLTRVLSLAGATLPRRLLGPLEENETGFWEPVEIVEAHEELLRSAGTRWDHVLESPAQWCRSPMAEPCIARLEELVRSNYGDSPLIVIKDPRICRLMPLWLKVLERMEIRPCCVLPVRNPLEVAASLKKRNGFPISKSTLLWLRYVLDAERDSRGLARSFLRFESLYEDPRRALAKISEDLGLVWPRASYRTDLEIEEFVSEALRHHRLRAGEVHAHSQVSEWVKRASDALMEGLGGDEEQMRHRLDAIQEEFAGAERAFGPILVDAERTAAGLLADRVGPLERRVAELEALSTAAERSASERGAKADAEIARLTGEMAAIEASARQSIEAEAARRDHRIEELQTEVGSLWAEVARRDHRIEELQTEVGSLWAEVARRDHRIEELQTEVGSLWAEVARRDHRIEELQTEVGSLWAEVARRDHRIEELQTEVGSLWAEVARWDHRIEELQAEAARRDHRIEELLAEVGSLRLARDALAVQLEGIKGSNGWKLLRVLRRMDRALVPPGSRRYRASRQGLRALAILRHEGPSGLIRRAARRTLRPNPRVALNEPGVLALEGPADSAAAEPTMLGCCVQCRADGGSPHRSSHV